MEQSITVIIDNPSKEIEVIMPKEETIELRHIRGVIGEKEDLPSLNPRASLSSRIRSLITKVFDVPQLIHLYGALGLNKTLTLAAGENTVTSLFSDGTYLYAGLSLSPGKIVKIDLSTFTEVLTLTLDSGENSVTSLFSDGIYLYAGLGTNPGKIVRINLSNFTKKDTLTFNANNGVLSLFSDGTNLYAGLTILDALDSGKLVKIDLSTFTETTDITPDAGIPNTVIALFSDGIYLYAGLNTAFVDSEVVKINLNTFTVTSTLTLDTGENDLLSLFSDGIYLYAGLSTVPGMIVKIDLYTFTKIGTLTFATNEDEVTAMFSDGTNLYASIGTSPSQIIIVNIATFKEIGTFIFNAGDDTSTSIFSDSSYLYTGTNTSPGRINKKYIIPSSDMHQRKIDITKECIQSIVSATTSNGLSTTLIDTARTEGNDYWNNMTVLILGGTYKGQSRRISDFDAASDTITVAPAFNGAILSGVRYAILPNVATGATSTLTQVDILSDATPFAGADVAIIKGYTGNLVATITTGTNSHTNDTNEQDVLEFAAATQDMNVYLDMVNITQTATIREYIKVDGTTYRQITSKIFPTDFDTSTVSIALSFKQPNRAYKVTLQSGVAEGSVKNIPYSYRTELRS